MRVAVPVFDEVFCEHFGRANGFFLCEIDLRSGRMDRPRFVVRPKAKCEAVPVWLSQMGVNAVLAGGIGQVASHRLTELKIEVTAGLSGKAPAEIVARYLASSPGPQKNPCPDMEHRHHHCRQVKKET